jgi:hypothetical protein
MLRRHLQQMEEHLALSDKLITDQRALIARLEVRGYDTAQTKTTLAHLEELRSRSSQSERVFTSQRVRERFPKLRK